MTKLVQSRWLNIGLVDPFLRFAKMSLSQYPDILTSTWSITHIYMHNKNPLEFAVLAGTSEWKLTDTHAGCFIPYQSSSIGGSRFG